MELNITKKQLIVLFSTILLTIGYYFLALFYVRNPLTPQRKDIVFFHWIFGFIFGDSPWIDYFQYIYQFLMSFLLLFMVPILIIKYCLKEDMEDLKGYGLQVGEKKFNLIWTLIGFGLIPLFFFSAADPTLWNEYPLTSLVTQDLGVFIFYYIIYFFYYLGYENIYRGYLQFGLKTEQTGTFGIIIILIIQTAITTGFHIGKPILEIMGVVVVGPIFGYITLKGKSVIWPALIFHFALGLINDFGALFWSSLL